MPPTPDWSVPPRRALLILRAPRTGTLPAMHLSLGGMRLVSIGLMVLAACDRPAPASSAPALTAIAGTASDPRPVVSGGDEVNPFELQLKQRPPIICEQPPVPPGSLAADCMSDVQAGDFLSRLQRALRTKNRAALAEAMNYPIVIAVDGSPSELVIHDADEFVRSYDKIVTPPVTAAIRNATVRSLSVNLDGVTIGGDVHHFVNYRGIALGRGTVWFDLICGVDDCVAGARFLVRTIDARQK